MMIEDYADLDATDLAARIALGELTASQVLEEAIARAERVNPKLNALVYPWFDHARARVREGLPAGPLHGVPFLLKDLYEDYAGLPHSNGCRALDGTVADHDAELVRRYKAAGLSIFGRTTSPEFGLSTTTESALLPSIPAPPRSSTGYRTVLIRNWAGSSAAGNSPAASGSG